MVAGIVGVEVTDGQGGVQRLLHVAVLEAVLLVGAVGPGAGVAVGLELEVDGRQSAVEEAELGLDLVAVLVRDDVGDGKVADVRP